ncbi:MAG: hypothetical protein WC804_10880 [Sphingomonas sp.]|jgi:hypothetical protein|uniref:hypothetical protein n=1 Tax=Sphingomonas sp. TaxID=28214 RepID=UPI003565CFF8
MAIDTIQLQTRQVAAYKRRLMYEITQSKLQGAPVDQDRRKSYLDSIQLGKFEISFGIFDLKMFRWGSTTGGAVDPTPFRTLRAELSMLQKQVDKFAATL